MPFPSLISNTPPKKAGNQQHRKKARAFPASYGRQYRMLMRLKKKLTAIVFKDISYFRLPFLASTI